MSSGQLFELARGDGESPQVFTKASAVRSKSLESSRETIDTTNSDSDNVRELLPGGGIKSKSSSFGGVVKIGNAQLLLVQADFESGAIVDYQITVPGLSTYIIPCQVTSFATSGDHNGSIDYSVSLESAGDWVTVDF